MKKLVLSAAVAFFATASAMAQTNVDTSTQTGSGHNGSTTQTGSANSNILNQGQITSILIIINKATKKVKPNKIIYGMMQRFFLLSALLS